MELLPCAPAELCALQSRSGPPAAEALALPGMAAGGDASALPFAALLRRAASLPNGGEALPPPGNDLPESAELAQSLALPLDVPFPTLPSAMPPVASPGGHEPSGGATYTSPPLDSLSPELRTGAAATDGAKIENTGAAAADEPLPPELGAANAKRTLPADPSPAARELASTPAPSADSASRAAALASSLAMTNAEAPAQGARAVPPRRSAATASAPLTELSRPQDIQASDGARAAWLTANGAAFADAAPHSAPPTIGGTLAQAGAVPDFDGAVQQISAQPGANAAPVAAQQVVPAAAGQHSAGSLDMAAQRWNEALAGRVHWMIDHEIGEARIKLNPPELGALDVKISLVDDKTYVQLNAHSAAARDELAQSLPRLRELLSMNGLELGGATVGDGREQGAANSRHAESATAPRDLVAVPTSGTAAFAPRSESRIDLYA